MSKVRETLNLIQSGARSNKYRILYPLFGQEIDILCHSTSNPGREIGTTEVFLKGRKYQMAGDMSDEGTWNMTIYNTEDFLVRSFFLTIIAGIQNFNNPQTLEDDIIHSIVQSVEGLVYQNAHYDFLQSTGHGGLPAALNTVNEAYNQVRANWESIANTIQNFQTLIQDVTYNTTGNHFTSTTLRGESSYAARPWYMTDIIIQQLDHDGHPVTETILNNAFISSVGPIEYNDETGNISVTELTFTYSGIEYGVAKSYIRY